MALRGTPLVPSAITKTIVCINQFEGAEYAGELHNAYMPTSLPFSNMREMIDKLESFFNDVSFPQAFCDLRTFQNAAAKRQHREVSPHQYQEDFSGLELRGNVATFILQVQFRQNASWQGRITWLEKDQTQVFRSMVEMLRLILAAMEQIMPESTLITWESTS